MKVALSGHLCVLNLAHPPISISTSPLSASKPFNKDSILMSEVPEKLAMKGEEVLMKKGKVLTAAIGTCKAIKKK